MNRGFYSESKQYHIYCLISQDGTAVYIGKTKRGHLNTVRTRHARGEINHTLEVFSQYGNEPDIYVLDTLNTTGAEAYRYVVAWCRFFKEHGFFVLNPAKTVHQAEALLPETQRVYDQIKDKPLHEVLVVPDLLSKTTTTHSDSLSIEVPVRPVGPSCQMNIRVAEKDQAAFRKFCHNTGLSQRDAFAALLNSRPSGEIERLLELVSKHSAKNKLLTHENERLRSLMAQPAEDRSKSKAATSRLRFAQTAIRNYLKILFPHFEFTSEPLPELRYVEFQHFFPNAEQYAYPKTDGFFIVELHAIVWSKSHSSPVYFVLAETDDHAFLKFRVYPKQEFVGLQINGNPYACNKARWLLGGKITQDNVAFDLLAAFPLPEAFPHLTTEEIAELKEHLSLEMQIKRASAKAQRQ